MILATYAINVNGSLEKDAHDSLEKAFRNISPEKFRDILEGRIFVPKKYWLFVDETLRERFPGGLKFPQGATRLDTYAILQLINLPPQTQTNKIKDYLPTQQLAAA